MKKNGHEIEKIKRASRSISEQMEESLEKNKKDFNNLQFEHEKILVLSVKATKPIN